MNCTRHIKSALAPLWLVDLDHLCEAKQNQFADLLDAAERERAARFGLADRRLQHVVAHGLKRLILGKITGARSNDLQFGVGSFGKPYLLGYPRIDFSLAHCDGLVGIAVSARGNVGLDLEPGVRVIDDRIAARYLSLPEQTSPNIDRIRLWTLKEAYVKATGHGITEAFRSFTAALDPPAIDALQPCRAWQDSVTQTHIAAIVLLDAKNK